MTFIPSFFASQHPIAHLPLTFTYIPSHSAQHYLHLCTHFISSIWVDSHWDPWTSLENCPALPLSYPSLPLIHFRHSPSPLKINLVHVFTYYHGFILFCPLCAPFFPLCPTLPPFTPTSPQIHFCLFILCLINHHSLTL